MNADLADALREFGLRVNVSLVILTVALLMSRILPVIILSPFLGGEVVPTEVKIGLGVMLSIVLYPFVADRVTLIPTGAFPFVLVLLKELFIGVCIAFVVNMVFEAAKVAGGLADTLGGTAMAQLHVPQIQQTVSIFSSLKLQFAVVLFLTLHGHHIVIEALAESLRTVPLDRFPAWSGGMWGFFDLILRVSADLFLVGVGLASPVILASFLTDLSLGMINKVAPQIQVYFISMSIKPMVAVLMVLVALHLLTSRFIHEFQTMFRMLHDAIGRLG
ncbi:MAG: flagellar biosynthetic protein FliR [Myxococcaceae bacterium]|nr:flagellar biosynthetic protein FliR [Myxococcaceae bacterium]